MYSLCSTWCSLIGILLPAVKPEGVVGRSLLFSFSVSSISITNVQFCYCPLADNVINHQVFCYLALPCTLSLSWLITWPLVRGTVAQPCAWLCYCLGSWRGRGMQGAWPASQRSPGQAGVSWPPTLVLYWDIPPPPATGTLAAAGSSNTLGEHLLLPGEIRWVEAQARLTGSLTLSLLRLNLLLFLSRTTKTKVSQVPQTAKTNQRLFLLPHTKTDSKSQNLQSS